MAKEGPDLLVGTAVPAVRVNQHCHAATITKEFCSEITMRNRLL